MHVGLFQLFLFDLCFSHSRSYADLRTHSQRNRAFTPEKAQTWKKRRWHQARKSSSALHVVILCNLNKSFEKYQLLTVSFCLSSPAYYPLERIAREPSSPSPLGGPFSSNHQVLSAIYQNEKDTQALHEFDTC